MRARGVRRDGAASGTPSPPPFPLSLSLPLTPSPPRECHRFPEPAPSHPALEAALFPGRAVPAERWHQAEERHRPGRLPFPCPPRPPLSRAGQARESAQCLPGSCSVSRAPGGTQRWAWPGAASGEGSQGPTPCPAREAPLHPGPRAGQGSCHLVLPWDLGPGPEPAVLTLGCWVQLVSGLGLGPPCPTGAVTHSPALPRGAARSLVTRRPSLSWGAAYSWEYPGGALDS